jgi:predicted phage terminase large subunit-like protein
MSEEPLTIEQAPQAVADELGDTTLLSSEEEERALKLRLRLQLLGDRKVKQESFIEFVKAVWPDFIAGPHHKIFADKLDRVAKGELKRLIVNMPPRHELRGNTPIFTTKGWKTIDTVEAGDFVFAPNGEPVLVTGKSDRHYKRIYEVETTDGHVVECDDNHLWTCSFRTRGAKDFENCMRTYRTKQLFEAGKPKRGGPYLPNWDAVKLPDADLPIDPWVLGVWLGDGASASGVVGCSFADKAEMKDRVEACGYEVTDNPKYQQFNVLGLLVQLRELGVLEDKHIPDCYFTASIAQREALLQGLIDTDGSVGKNGRVTFHQTSKFLAEQVQSLVCSLGVKCRLTSRQTKDNGLVQNSKVSYRLNFRHPRAALLARKESRLGDLSKLSGRALTVRETDTFDWCQCLKVANEDGLFLVGRGFVCTHNTKSEFASFLFPAYTMGREPSCKIIQATHTTDLAVDFGRKVKNLLDSEVYTDIFEDVKLAPDAKASGRWNTTLGGMYYAVGVGTNLAGRGGDLIIIDDPHSENSATPAGFQSTWEWYTGGPRQRVQPGAAIIVVQTRWDERDLTGKLVKQMAHNPKADQWEVVEFPFELPSGRPVWPQYWSQEELEGVKNSIPPYRWNAQYQQQPTGETNAIIKREDWKVWPHKFMPRLDYVLQSFDTAYSKSEQADYSAITTWGVFNPREYFNDCEVTRALILLDAKKGRWDFHILKEEALKNYKYWDPDMVLIEAKASGMPLTHELRNIGIPVVNFTPTRGNDKIARTNAVQPVFASGMVYAPEDHWAKEVIEEVAGFPNAEFDDYHDSTVQAVSRFRQGGFVKLPTDAWDDEGEAPVRRTYY